MYFNRKYRTVGHLFQGRYKAILCDREGYLLALLKYIHYNPLRARIEETLGEYPWSSYRSYLAKPDEAGLVDIEQVLRMFSENKNRARKRYEAFMNDGATVKKEDVYATIDQRVLGDERFVEDVTERYDGIIRKERRKREYSLMQIAAAVVNRGHLTVDELQSSSRAAMILQGRVLFSFIAREYGYRGREIAAYLKKDPAAVTGYLKKGESIRSDVEKVIEVMSKEGQQLNL
jgi:DNA-binding transcriptional ArsR family regulator